MSESGSYIKRSQDRTTGGRENTPGAFFFGLPRRFGGGFTAGLAESIANQVHTRLIKHEEGHILPGGSAAFALAFRDAGSSNLELPGYILKT